MKQIEKQSFSADSTVADILARSPQTASVFLRHRMACVGCPMATFETLDSPAKAYEFAFEEFLGELEFAAAGSS